MRTLSTALISTLTFLTLANGASASEQNGEGNDSKLARPNFKAQDTGKSADVRLEAVKKAREEERAKETVKSAVATLARAEVKKEAPVSPSKQFKIRLEQDAARRSEVAQVVDSEREKKIAELEAERIRSQEAEARVLRDSSMRIELENLLEGDLPHILSLEEGMETDKEGKNSGKLREELLSRITAYSDACVKYGNTDFKNLLSDWHGYLLGIISADEVGEFSPHKYWLDNEGKNGVTALLEKLGENKWK